MTQRALVTGASGQLGRELMRAAARAGIEAVGLGRAELDVTDAAAVDEAVARLAPDTIFHCAAWTAVDDAEAEPAAALAVNEGGTRAVAEAAERHGAHLVCMSTDYVFDGSSPEGYVEDDPVAPLNAYGASKLAAERAAQEASPGCTIVRTAWLFGDDGTNFVRTIARLARERDTLDVVDDQRGSPTYAGHLAEAMLACAERRLAGVVHLAGSPVATWHDVAREVVEQLGVECEVRPVTSAEFPRPAPRPACSVLRSTRPDAPVVGDWREGVRAVLHAERTRAAIATP